MRTDKSEAVFFFGKKGLAKEMLYTEFEAVLDGVVGVPEFAGHEVQGAYLTIDTDLSVKACVLFLIEFDDKGHADRDWNIPLRHLAENAGPGPDLGNGPIRLACRSQCSVAWYQRELWEPTSRDGMNHFIAIREAVKRNRLGIIKQATKPQVEIPVVTSEEPPLLNTQIDMASTEEIENLKAQLKQKDDLFRDQLTALVSQHKQQMVASEEQRKQEIDQIKRVMRNESQVHKNEAQSFQQKLAQQTVLHENLTEKFIKLTEDHTGLLSKYENQKEKLDQLKDSHLELLQKQTENAGSESAEMVSLRQQVIKMQSDLDKAKDTESDLKQEMLELEHRLQTESGEQIDKFIERLHDQDLVFVAYHLGAGHMSLPAKMLKEYLSDPYSFAAQKCNVPVSQYQDWVQHYENSACQECGVPVKRIDNPSEFIDGHHNYCVRHKKVAGNIAPLRRSV